MSEETKAAFAVGVVTGIVGVAALGWIILVLYLLIK